MFLRKEKVPHPCAMSANLLCVSFEFFFPPSSSSRLSVGWAIGFRWWMVREEASPSHAPFQLRPSGLAYVPHPPMCNTRKSISSWRPTDATDWDFFFFLLFFPFPSSFIFYSMVAGWIYNNGFSPTNRKEKKNPSIHRRCCAYRVSNPSFAFSFFYNYPAV